MYLLISILLKHDRRDVYKRQTIYNIPEISDPSLVPFFPNTAEIKDINPKAAMPTDTIRKSHRIKDSGAVIIRIPTTSRNTAIIN